ncbi:MAG TPA: DEAD/DEAH box helicase family protein [Candidatus Competibacteraceae bacterium]|nr:DEAD/DEAH box helicase family protein [Candidatus Competibacteraceae bacterium]
MSKQRIRELAADYALFESARPAAAHLTLRYDRGTLLLEGGVPPPGLESAFAYDPRVDAWRAPALLYPALIPALRPHLAGNSAARYGRLSLEVQLDLEPRPHQREALEAWFAARGRGQVVLPTGAGKTLVGLLAMAQAGRDALVVVPTLELMRQWYGLLRLAFPEREIGLIGGGYHEPYALAVATYDSAARHAEHLGNRYGTLIFDEMHHLPAEFYRVIAEYALAPYRLGLSATPERADGLHRDLDSLVGPVVYRRRPAELAGDVLARYRIQPLLVELSAEERAQYREALALRNRFLQEHRIGLGSLAGWNRFVMLSARSPEGRRAMQAHRAARRIAHATASKLRALEDILTRHRDEKTVIFTEDNATAYEIARRFLIPCLTHQTRVKERQHLLDGFRSGQYRALVTSNVLNEGVDVPDASIGVILSGSASAREFVQRLGRILRRAADGKQAVLYELVARETREEQVAERRRQAPAACQGDSLDLFARLDGEDD